MNCLYFFYVLWISFLFLGDCFHDGLWILNHQKLRPLMPFSFSQVSSHIFILTRYHIRIKDLANSPGVPKHHTGTYFSPLEFFIVLSLSPAGDLVGLHWSFTAPRVWSRDPSLPWAPGSGTERTQHTRRAFGVDVSCAFRSLVEQLYSSPHFFPELA